MKFQKYDNIKINLIISVHLHVYLLYFYITLLIMFENCNIYVSRLVAGHFLLKKPFGLNSNSFEYTNINI